jgi:hypothetical protein
LIQRRHELHQGVDRPAHDTPTPLHALDRRHREASLLGKHALVDPEQRSSRLQLARSNHSWNIYIDVSDGRIREIIA